MSSDFYKFEIHSKVIKLTKYLQVLKSRHYSNNAPIKLAGDLQRVLDVVGNNLDSVLDVHLHDLNNFLETNFLNLCAFIEKSSPSYVPWSLIPELEELSSKLIASDEFVIIRADNNFNYSIHIVDIISEYLNILRQFLGDIDELKDQNYIRPRIFTIPLLEKNNVLLHSILFHEIGHFYEKKFSESNEIKAFINSTIASLLKEEITDETLFTAGEATDILKGFIREIYSDIFALYYCGLPMLFSTYHFQKAYPEPSLPSQNNNFYPPIKYRLRVMYDICVSEGMDNEIGKSNHDSYKILMRIMKDIEKILKDKNDLNILDSKTSSLLAIKAFGKIIDKIKNDIKSKIDIQLMDLKNVDKLFDKLLESIPPCEINRKPQNIVKILTAGWAVYYYYYEKIGDISKRYEKIKTLNLLCLKALTQSFFFRKFQEADNGDPN